MYYLLVYKDSNEMLRVISDKLFISKKEAESYIKENNLQEKYKVIFILSVNVVQGVNDFSYV